MEETIYEEVARVIGDALLRLTPISQEEMKQHLILDLGLDSLDMASVVVRLEGIFKTVVTDDQVEWSSVRTGEDLFKLFQSKSSE